MEACARVSGGNPFLAGELVRSLQADRIPPTAQSVPDVVRLVPESVLRSVLVRLTRLGEHGQRLAGAIAVLGDGAALRHAGVLAELDSEAADRAADALARAHILDSGEPLRFTHPLIATAVHSDLPSFARGRAHRRAADLLAADGAPPEAVAAHLLMTWPDGDQQTVVTLRRAAERTLARGDPAAAVHLLRRALSEPPVVQNRAEVLLELSAAEVGAGELGADVRLDEALGLLHDPAERARALAALGRLRFQEGNHAEAARMVQEALDQLDANDPAAQALVVDELSATILQAGLSARANARLAPLMTAARRGRLPEHPGLLAHLALALALAGDPPELVLCVAERATSANPLVDPASHGMLAGIVVQALVCVDELDAAERVADDALQASQRLGSLLAYASASYHRAIPRYHRGALSDALADLDQALTASAEGWTAAEGWIGALQVQVHLQRGELDAARDALSLTADMAPESMHRSIALFARAQVKLTDSDAAGALSDARAAGQYLIEGFGIDHPGFLPWRCTAALAADAAGDPREADRLAGEALERARSSGVPRAIGLALRTVATLADDDRAVTLLEQATIALQDSPSMLERAHTLVNLGGARRRVGRGGAARPPLRHGLELADRLGATVRATGARPRRAAYTGAAALTPTERRVAQLAAQGLTNPEIAQALFVTTSTIHTHLAHTYRKLEVDSRRQLAHALSEQPRP
jgi:DNA-binding CsgD family transcriptional regulator